MAKRWVGITLGGAGVLMALVALAATRWSLLARAGRRLVREASMLPKGYTVGVGPPLRMVALGDSTAEGVGAGSLEATLPYRVASGLGARVTVTNLAVSGARLADVVRDQLPKLPASADLALVSISANDATHGTDTTAFEVDLARLLDGLRGARRIVLTTTPNFRTTPALPSLLNRRFGRRAAALTAITRRVSVRYPSVALVDLYREGTLTRTQYAADGFHPNAEGYRAWATLFLRALGKG